MMKIIYSLIACSLLIPALHRDVAASESAPDPVKFGSVAMDTPAQMQLRLKPLINYLSKELNRPVILKLSNNMTSAINHIVSGEVNFAYLTPVAYVNARERANTKLVVKALTERRGSFSLAIIVHQSSAIKTIADLENKKFAFGDPAALLQRAVVVNAGMPLEKLNSYGFLEHYDNVVRSVLHGDFDAGIVTDTTASRWESKGIRTLYLSEQLPAYNITASSNTSETLVSKVQNALLKLDSSNPQHRPVLESLDKLNTGFAETTDSEYDIIRSLVAPFQKKK